MDWLLQHLEGHGGQIDFTQAIVTLLFATIYSYAIAFTYAKTFSGKKFSRNFAHSIILLGVLVSLVIAIIGNSVARAFGVFGALSIIRYRVPIRDPKDITFVLASVVVGLACGVQEYPEAGIATLFLIILVTIIYRFPLGLTGAGGQVEPEHDELSDEADFDEDGPDHEVKKKKKKKNKHKDEEDAADGEAKPDRAKEQKPDNKENKPTAEHKPEGKGH
ncbi:MAG: DUF4956 domain-containing protein [Gemmataceae bacterium]